MSQKIIIFSKVELNNLINDENSCVRVIKKDYYLQLFPYHLTNLNTSIKAILNARIAKYDRNLSGILLGYQNLKLITPAGSIQADSFYIHINIEAEFYIFEPEINSTLVGVINKVSKNHVGCLVHKIFNVSIPNNCDDENWIGSKVEIGDTVKLLVEKIRLDSRLPYIMASIVKITSKNSKTISNNHKTFDSDEEQIENEYLELSQNQKVPSEEILNGIESPIKEKKKKHKHRKHDLEEEEEEEEKEEEELNIISLKLLKKEMKKLKKQSLDNSVVDSVTEVNEITESSEIIKKQKKKSKKYSEDAELLESIIEQSPVKQKKSKKKSLENLEDDNVELIVNEKKNQKRQSLDTEALRKQLLKEELNNLLLNKTWEMSKKEKKKLQKELENSDFILNDSLLKEKCKSKRKNHSTLHEEELKTDSNTMENSLNSGKKKKKKSHSEPEVDSMELFETPETKKKRNSTKYKILDSELSKIELNDSEERNVSSREKSKKKKSKVDELCETSTSSCIGTAADTEVTKSVKKKRKHSQDVDEFTKHVEHNISPKKKMRLNSTVDTDSQNTELSFNLAKIEALNVDTPRKKSKKNSNEMLEEFTKKRKKEKSEKL